MSEDKIKINRAPVLTLWGAVVAERLGFDSEEALTLGKAVAGLNAQSKGQRLGIFQPGEADESERKRLREREAGETVMVEIVGRPVPAVNTEGGLRATAKGEPIEPRSVQRYLEKKFGADLDRVREALAGLAASYGPKELASRAYDLYEKFRPEVPEGARGWGAAGDLDLDKIRKMKKRSE
jgi:hypothetical protein